MLKCYLPTQMVFQLRSTKSHRKNNVESACMSAFLAPAVLLTVQLLGYPVTSGNSPATPYPSPSLFVWIHAPQHFSPLWDTVSFHFPSHSLICLHFPTYGAGLRASALLRDPGAAGVTCWNATMTSAQPGKSPYPPSLSILFAMRHWVPWWKSHPPSK